MSDAPPVSVVMPVYNAARVVAEAIESILSQTFTDFEFIVVDDGSTDETGRILGEYARRDGRIKLYTQENCGLISSLNRYCRLARGKYIARMDADDISLPTRLERQFRFLETHPEIGVLGTWIQDIDEKRAHGVPWPAPASPAAVRWFLMFGDCIAHPSVMMRRDVLDRVGYYASGAVHVEDYDLWIRASNVTGLANIPEVLLQYRISGSSVSGRNQSVQEQKSAGLKHELMASVLGRAVSLQTIEALRQSGEGSAVHNGQAALEAAELLRELYLAYMRKFRPSRDERAQIALDICRRLWLLALFTREISFAKILRIGLRSSRFVPLLFSFDNIKRIFSLSAWLLKYRQRIFISQRRVL